MQLAASHGMIEPFTNKTVEHGIISYGLSSYGYDARLHDEFKIFTNVNTVLIDPKQPMSGAFQEVQHSYCIIPPNSYVLARTVEYFRIPRDVLAILPRS